jgi:hypothetical protein
LVVRGRVVDRASLNFAEVSVFEREMLKGVAKFVGPAALLRDGWEGEVNGVPEAFVAVDTDELEAVPCEPSLLKMGEEDFPGDLGFAVIGEAEVDELADAIVSDAIGDEDAAALALDGALCFEIDTVQE